MRGETANPAFYCGHADQVYEIQRRFERDHARVVTLPKDFELARAFEIIGPAGRDDRRPKLRDPLGAHVQKSSFERAHEPFVRADGV